MKQLSKVKVAIIDMNNNTPNQSMRCLRQMLWDLDRKFLNQKIEYQVFDARHKTEMPGLEYDIYLSTGGPGSPYDGEGTAWELAYFRLLDKIWNHNRTTEGSKKYVFFICHSFQLMCRFFDFVKVTKRHSQSFGITYVHKTEKGKAEPCFEGLPDPFYVADFRDWQAIEPDRALFRELGATILTMEKLRPKVQLERAVTAIRISEEMLATQFHPEADASGMRIHFSKPERREQIIRHHGEEKFRTILDGLEDRDKIELTHRTVIPTFLETSIRKLRGIEEQLPTSITFTPER